MGLGGGSARRECVGWVEVPPAESVWGWAEVPRAERAEWWARGEGKKMGGGGWGVHIGDLLPPPPIIFFFRGRVHHSAANAVSERNPQVAGLAGLRFAICDYLIP